jgi:hypothetical protein
MSQIKQIILIVFLAAILPSFTAIGYVYSLSPAERWLLMMRQDAQHYAEALLAEDAAKQARFRNEFKEYKVVANPDTRTVLFSSRKDSERLALIYAPNESAAWLNYEQAGAKRVRERWYELVQ